MKTNFLKKIFYMPNYLSLPAAGIEICNKSVKYVEFLNKKGIFSIKNFGEIPLAQNVVKDGEILNKNALSEVLVEVKKKISSDFVKVSIPEEKTYIFDTQIPREAKNDIRDALEFKIEENVPLKLEESSFEYEIVDDCKETSKDMVVSVSVIPKAVISSYMEVLDLAGIHPVSFEAGSKMMANSVISNEDKGNSIIVNIKDDSTVLVAVIDGFVRFTSIISVGENTIIESLQKTASFKNKLSSGQFFEKDFSLETKDTDDLYPSLVNIFSILKDEIEKFDEYILNKFPVIKNSLLKNVDKIILCGRISVLPGLAKHVNQNIKTEVVLGNTLLNVIDVKKHVSLMKFNDSLKFATSIGLAVSSFKDINA